MKIARGKDKKVVRVVEEMKKTEVKVLQGDEWQIEGDLMLEKGKVYIPKYESLRVEIIQLYYDVLVVGYRRRWKMMKLVMRNYWCTGVIKNVGKNVNRYDMCQRMKNKTEALVEKLKLSEILEKLQTHLTVNFITKLLLVAGKDAILVVCNRLSKMTYFVATIERTLVERLVRPFRDNIWKLYKLPESVVLDRGLQFVVEPMRELNKILEIETKLLMSFYLQIDEQTEWINQKLEQYL